MMKKLILVFSLLLVAASGFAQISKADAAGFVSRNLSEAQAVVIYNTVGISSDRTVRSTTYYAKADVVSLTALESGYSLVIKHSTGNKEKFYPYASILYMVMNGDSELCIMFKD